MNLLKIVFLAFSNKYYLNYLAIKPLHMLKKLLFAVLCLPVFSYAHVHNLGKPVPKKLLTTIISDTLNGQFLKIKIKYDQLNRVVTMLQTDNRLVKGGKMQVRKVLSQDFEYDGNSLLPIFRMRATYGYNKELVKDTIYLYEKQFFIYENGKRVGDSIFSNLNSSTPTDADVTSYSKSEDTVFLMFGVKPNYPYPLTYFKTISYKQNLVNAEFSSHTGHHNGVYFYYKFQKFDRAINPLQNLNIADILSSDMYDFANADEDPEGQPIKKEDPPCLPINYLGWAYLNKNNPTRFTKNGSDSRTTHECIRKNISTIMYTYNQFNLPVRCKVQVKTINFRQLDKMYVDCITNRSFNFTYKNAVN